MIEIGDRVLVIVDGAESLREVTEIHDNGCISLGPPGDIEALGPLQAHRERGLISIRAGRVPRQGRSANTG